MIRIGSSGRNDFRLIQAIRSRRRYHCEFCGGGLRVIADVTRPDVINKILEHVARQQAPPELSAIGRMTTVH